MAQISVGGRAGDSSNSPAKNEPKARSQEGEGAANKLRAQKRKKQKNNFENFITAHHVGLVIGFSGLLIVSGLVFMLISLGAIAETSRDLLAGIITAQEERYILAAIGLMLVASPFFLNRFVFKAIRYERELRLRAQKSTREAQLLQDVLTHDIRNYNQVSRLSAELIAEETRDVAGTEGLVANLLNSIAGSTQLVERAKMLGRVISDQDLLYSPMNLLRCINRSMQLVSSANPEKTISAVVKLGSSPSVPLGAVDLKRNEVSVLADDLLDEVFSNLFSNSVKYTDGAQVFIAIELNQGHDKQLKRKCWKISISDLGKGIPDELKVSIFSRYLDGAKGSGLGMSIVHALVVGRYNGRIKVQDRVENDYTKGTMVEIWLPAA
ncbi:MAG TPA: HAMP domain-containing sensor histidine kinase [Nitrososphaerales archaeon]|nr:HAMP domain-containing sensor histidine kinase [Nitrososphaerales archaeon]